MTYQSVGYVSFCMYMYYSFLKKRKNYNIHPSTFHFLHLKLFMRQRYVFNLNIRHSVKRILFYVLLLSFQSFSGHSVVCHVVSGHSVVCHVVSGHSVVCHVVSGHSVVCHVVSGYSVVCHVVSGHSVVCHVVSGHSVVVDNTEITTVLCIVMAERFSR